MYIAAVMTACFVAHSINSIIMSGNAPKQNALNIAPQNQTSIVKQFFGQEQRPLTWQTRPCAHLITMVNPALFSIEWEIVV